MSRRLHLLGLLVVLSLFCDAVAARLSADEPSKNGKAESKQTEAKTTKLPSPLSWPAGKVIFHQSEAAKQIRAALEQPVECDFDSVPLNDVADWIEDKLDATVILDQAALAADVNDGTLPITKKGRFTSLANALSVILDEQGLTYLVKHDVLVITTKTAASAPENLTTRIYQVHDLVVAPNDPTALQPDFDALIEILTCSIRNQDWQDVGGTIGYVKPFYGPGSLALVITHDEQGHREIEQLFKMLRESRVQQIIEAQEKQPYKERPPQPPQQEPFILGPIPVVG
jgi:hypothetical protein